MALTGRLRRALSGLYRVNDLVVFHARPWQIPDLPPVDGVTVGVLSEDALVGQDDALSRLDATPADCREQLARGELGVAAWSDGRLVGFIWYAFGPCPSKEFGGLVHPTPHSVYVYHANVAPELKGRGIAEAIGNFAVPVLRDRGVRSGWMSIRVENRPSLRALEKSPLIFAAYDVRCTLTPFGRRFRIARDDEQLRAFLGMDRTVETLARGPAQPLS